MTKSEAMTKPDRLRRRDIAVRDRSWRGSHFEIRTSDFFRHSSFVNRISECPSRLPQATAGIKLERPDNLPVARDALDAHVRDRLELLPELGRGRHGFEMVAIQLLDEDGILTFASFVIRPEVELV